MRLFQDNALELKENRDLLAGRHLGELVEVVARYLDPWIENSELGCGDAKTLILTLVGTLIGHNSLQRVFPGKELGPKAVFQTYRGIAFLEPGERQKAGN